MELIVTTQRNPAVRRYLCVEGIQTPSCQRTGQVVAEDTQVGQGVFTRNGPGPDVKGTVLRLDMMCARADTSRRRWKSAVIIQEVPPVRWTEPMEMEGRGFLLVLESSINLQDSGRPGLTLGALTFSGARILAWEHLIHIKNLAGTAFRAKTFLLKSDRCGT